MGKKVMLIAGDTFRAAAEEQLDIWASRANVDIWISLISADLDFDSVIFVFSYILLMRKNRFISAI